MNSLHLSNELQRELDAIGSSICLNTTIDGTLPEAYAFVSNRERTFSVKPVIDNAFSFELCERPVEDKDYFFCAAKGVCKDIATVATIAYLWSEKHQPVQKIATDFPGVELFQDISCRNINPAIDAAWTKVKNNLFRNEQSPDHEEWRSRYDNLLEKAKANPLLSKLTPFTSHYWLRFSVDLQITETWPLFVYIVPTFYSSDTPSDRKPFCVSYDDNEDSKKYFETADEAVSFLGEFLQRVKPIKW